MQGYQKYIPECMNTLECTFPNAGDDSNCNPHFSYQQNYFMK